MFISKQMLCVSVDCYIFCFGNFIVIIHCDVIVTTNLIYVHHTFVLRLFYKYNYIEYVIMCACIWKLSTAAKELFLFLEACSNACYFFSFLHCLRRRSSDAFAILHYFKRAALSHLTSTMSIISLFAFCFGRRYM